MYIGYIPESRSNHVGTITDRLAKMLAKGYRQSDVGFAIESFFSFLFALKRI